MIVDNILKNQFQLRDISTYRSSLMGFAIIWIMLYHFTLKTPIIQQISGYGYGGVDIFMFLSGLGLYYSLSKKNFSLSVFLKKRISRIFPAYFIVWFILGFLINKDPFPTYLWKCTTIGYWTNNIYYDWFIPAIFSIYIIFPFMYKYTYHQKCQFTIIILILFSIILSFLCTNIFNNSIDNWHFLLIYRIPIFLYGTYIAHYITHNIDKKNFIITAFIGTCIAILLYVTMRDELRYKYILVSLIAPILIILLCLIFNRSSILTIWTKYIGNRSLEIYLIHLIFLHIQRISIEASPFIEDIITLIFCILSIVFGSILKFAIDQIFEIINKNRINSILH